MQAAARMKFFFILCVGVILSSIMHEGPRLYSFISLDQSKTVRQSRTPLDQKDNDSNRREPKLADGCYHVFLDVGSNIGVHARMLLEPRLYPSTSPSGSGKTKFSSRKFFKSQFGPEDTRDNTDFCIFAFEPNPAHLSRHKEMERVYGAMGWRYHAITAGVGDEDGSLTFYHIGRGNKELERGFTTVKSRCRHECRPEVVPVYRLSDWIDREIHGRKIPTKLNIPSATSSTPWNEPRVVMKMDIEMGEWLVFPDLLTSGVLCRDIDAILGEFHLETHKNDYPISFPRHDSGNWTLNTWQEAQVLKDEMFGMVERNPNCKTELVVGDDESYGADGMPWPTPPVAGIS